MRKVIIILLIQITLFNCCQLNEDNNDNTKKLLDKCHYIIKFYPLSKYRIDVNLFYFNYFPNNKLQDPFVCPAELNIDSLLSSNLDLPDSKFYSHLFYYSGELPIYKSSENYSVYRFLVSGSNNYFLILRIEKTDIPMCHIKIGKIFDKYSFYKLDTDTSFMFADSIWNNINIKIDSLSLKNENTLPNRISLNNNYLLFEGKKNNNYNVIKRALYENTSIHQIFNYVSKVILKSDSIQIPVI